MNVWRCFRLGKRPGQLKAHWKGESFQGPPSHDLTGLVEIHLSPLHRCVAHEFDIPCSVSFWFDGRFVARLVACVVDRRPRKILKKTTSQTCRRYIQPPPIGDVVVIGWQNTSEKEDLKTTLGGAGRWSWTSSIRLRIRSGPTFSTETQGLKAPNQALPIGGMCCFAIFGCSHEWGSHCSQERASGCGDTSQTLCRPLLLLPDRGGLAHDLGE